jgi:hypothetical protein
MLLWESTSLEKEKITGGCPRIEAVARKCWFESDFFIIWGEYRVYLTKIMGKSGRIQLFRSRFVFSDSLLGTANTKQSSVIVTLILIILTNR